MKLLNALRGFIISTVAALGLIAGVMTVIIGGVMSIVGTYVVFVVNDSIGHTSSDITAIYNKVMKAFLILSVGMIVVGAGVIFESLRM